MIFKKIVGVIELLFSLLMIASTFFGVFFVRPKVNAFLENLANNVEITDEGMRQIWESFLNSGSLPIGIIIMSLLIGILGLLFLLQGIVNLLPDNREDDSSSERESSGDGEVSGNEKQNKEDELQAAYRT